MPKQFNNIKDAFNYLVNGEGWSHLTVEQRNSLRASKNHFNNSYLSEKKMIEALNKFGEVKIETRVDVKLNI